jgi:hypothetical protein
MTADSSVRCNCRRLLRHSDVLLGCGITFQVCACDSHLYWKVALLQYFLDRHIYPANPKIRISEDELTSRSGIVPMRES